ncbi:hypothetical protein EV132_102458 [Rhizobium sullae]|uniref:Uncharacterized protein n=1 Tax=Rhizobium sullae TaxID=50338 RepID=A0A4R3QEN4_RHISU|nr:hypothetical protein EV132_102458 [Rhizobium sullae]
MAVASGLFKNMVRGTSLLPSRPNLRQAAWLL